MNSSRIPGVCQCLRHEGQPVRGHRLHGEGPRDVVARVTAGNHPRHVLLRLRPHTATRGQAGGDHW